MFYQELLEIENYKLYSELIGELDTWFAFLPPSQKNNITASRVAIKFDIDFTLAESILESCCILGILEKQYDLKCPTCDLKLKVVGENQLYDILTSTIDFCHNCDNENIRITLENIYISYRLVKKPSSSPDKIKKLTQEKFKINESNTNNSSTLINQIQNGNFNINQIFFNPSQEEKEKLNLLLSNLENESETTKEKGDLLEDLTLFLFSLVKSFRACKTVRTETNQIDCFVMNNIDVKSTVFNDLGSYFIVECKNENEKPDITYYRKLLSIMNDSLSTKVGIVVSILPATRPCYIASRESFLQNKALIINITKDDLKEIILNNYNLLDLIQVKIADVKVYPTKSLGDILMNNKKSS